MKQKIGMIGIGAMGKPMALNLLKAGYPLTAYSTNPQALKEVTGAGGTSAGSIAELAAAVEVVITIVPADREVLEVYTSEKGVIRHAKDGTVCLEMTSARGETVKEVEAFAAKAGKRIRFIDAPVSGGVAGAQAGTLTIMTGGERGLIDAQMPILQAMGSKIIYTGTLGSGKSVKMINQFLNAANTCIAAEALELARRMGLDLEILCSVVNESSGSSWVFKNNVPKFIVPGTYGTGFRLELMKKDVNLSVEQAHRDGLCLPLLADVFGVFQSMCNRGHGTENYNVVAEWVKMLNAKDAKP
ncbi:MAG: NAD(P)-dependent oxidoreductase [Deltaproteobacteria bacterium]|nr:NAD(P)-dependent oxidoreductase [Deltaproteobacteria bacterium]